MPEFEVTARLNRETKNKLRYEEVGEDGEVVDIREAKVGTMYVKKDIFDGEKPEKITIKVTLTTQ